MSKVVTHYDVHAMFDLVKKQAPSIYQEFGEKLRKTLDELMEKRSSPRGMITRLSNDPELLGDPTMVVPEGVWFLNILDMGERSAVADIDVVAVMKVFWVLDFNAGTIVDNSHTLESVH